MLKIFVRIIIVVLLAAILSTGIYFAFNSGTASQTVGSYEQGSRPALQAGTGNAQISGTAANGFHRGDGDSENSGAAWLDILKNLSIITIATLAVTLIRKVAVMQKTDHPRRESIIAGM